MKLFKKKQLNKDRLFYRFAIEPMDDENYFEIFIEFRKVLFIEKVFNLVFEVIPDEVFVVNKEMLTFLTRHQKDGWVKDNQNNGNDSKLTKEILQLIKKKQYAEADKKILTQFNEKTQKEIVAHLNKQDVENTK